MGVDWQGDSGFLIVRDGSVEFRSPPLQHFFDCPLQFAAYPDYTNATDSAEDAGLYQLPVQHGDLIVAGTDGLWDNVHQEEIVQILSSHQNDIQKVSNMIPFRACCSKSLACVPFDDMPSLPTRQSSLWREAEQT